MALIQGDQNIMSNIEEEEECYFQAIHLAMSRVIPMVLKAAVDLDLLEIIAKATPEGRKLSPIEIAAHLPTMNPDAPSIIDRILRVLASHSVLKCDVATDEDGRAQRLYSLAPIGRYFLHDDNGISLIPSLANWTGKTLLEPWYYLKEATLEGDIPFVKAYGMHLFELNAKNIGEINAQFNNAMSNRTAIVMTKILGKYKGFEGISQVVDVGGGLGTTLKLIVSKYPQIKGINFDLPHVIKDAPHFPGIDHVGGDMFIDVPQGDVIFMKWVLHDWDDDRCLKLLKNCYNALPEFGKVVVVETILPESPSTDIVTKNNMMIDMSMFNILPGAKERTKEQYKAMATKVGFTTFKLVCCAYGYWVMELHKGINSSQFGSVSSS